LQLPQYPQGGEVRFELGALTGRGEVLGTGRVERLAGVGDGLQGAPLGSGLFYVAGGGVGVVDVSGVGGVSGGTGVGAGGGVRLGSTGIAWSWLVRFWASSSLWASEKSLIA
jgi:hypothetical protein